MRLDKYLKVSRLIKRRTVAQSACAGSRVEVNGRTAKPAQQVKEGDVLTIRFGEKTAFRTRAPCCRNSAQRGCGCHV